MIITLPPSGAADTGKPALRIAVLDIWFGNEDAEAARRHCEGNAICQLLRNMGFQLELSVPAEPGERLDLVFFGGFGDGSAVDRFRCSASVFWCFENIHYFREFVPYRDHGSRYDFSFTFDPTTEQNFRITGAYFFHSLPSLRAAPPPSSINAALANKRDFACFLYSQGNEDEDGIKLRNDFFRRLSQRRFVTSGGEFLNNIGGPVPWEETGPFVARHRFVIAMENSISQGYATEKILHGFLHGSIPVYCGAPDIHLDYREDTFILYDGQNFDAVVETMERLEKDEGAYREMLSRPKLQSPPRAEYEPGALERRVAMIAKKIGF